MLSASLERWRQLFPWYDALLDADITDADPLHRFPLMDENLLLQHYYVAQNSRLADAEAYFTSGTTTGRRKTILYSQKDHSDYIKHRKQVLQPFLANVPSGAVAVAELGIGHAAASSKRIFEELGFAARDIEFSRKLLEHVELINEWQPAVLFTMPMILDRILASGAHFSPKKVIVLGDLAPEGWRRMVAERLFIQFEDILDLFGSTEIGAIAYYEAQTGLYHFHEHIIPELQLLPCSCLGGTFNADAGILVLTSLQREYFPALRYVTNDVISGLQRIRFKGRSIDAFAKIEGRLAGDLKYGERISQFDLVTALSTVFPGVEYEAAQNDGLEIRIAVDRISTEQAEAFRCSLMRACPDVAQMMESGLVPEYRLTAITKEQLGLNRPKRIFK